MRCLVSSTCLLLQIIAVLAVFATTTGALGCFELKDSDNLLSQLETCVGTMVGFSSSTNPVFDLSAATQDRINKLLYDNPKGTPVPSQLRKFNGHVKIINSELESFTLGMSNTGNGQERTVEIISNPNLSQLNYQIDRGINVTLILKGNKQLTARSIILLDTISEINKQTSKIQGRQECFFNGKIDNLSDLKDCKTIDGNLIINSQTVIPDPMPYISQINTIKNGCLKIENSNLTSLDFLTNIRKKQGQCTVGQHVIKNNTKLCLTSEEQEKWKTAGFELTNGGQCLDRCTAKFAKDNQDKAKAPCDVVVGDVKIIGSSVALAELDHWNRVKILEGTLEVDGTNLENIAIFKNLEKIVNPSPEKIALVVIKNQKMTKFDLPKLKNITMPPGAMSQPIFFQKNNPKFEFSSDESKKWNRITGQKKLLIPVKLEEKKEETSTNKNAKKYWIMGLAGTFSTLISLGMVAGAAFYAKRDFKKVEKIAKRRRAAKKRRSRKIGNRKIGSKTTGSKTTGKGKTGRKRRRSKIRRKRKCTTKSRTGKK